MCSADKEILKNNIVAAARAFALAAVSFLFGCSLPVFLHCYTCGRITAPFSVMYCPSSRTCRTGSEMVDR
jgi:hypothetical protein